MKSLRGFWQQLCDEWTDPVSYEAVRGYHYDREPPADYLARVADVFGYRLEWLISGQKPETHAEARALEAFDRGPWNARADRTEAEAIAEAFLATSAGWLLVSDAARARAVEVFGRYHAARERHAEMSDMEVPEPRATLQEFAGLLSAPMHWRMVSVSQDRLAAYADAAILTLSLSIPDGADYHFMNAEGGDDGEA